jgi:hypothetical protein
MGSFLTIVWYFSKVSVMSKCVPGSVEGGKIIEWCHYMFILMLKMLTKLYAFIR